LSYEAFKNLITYNERQVANNRGFSAKFRDPNEVDTMDALKVGGGGKDDLIKVGTWRTHKDGQGFRECEDGTCPTIPARAREDGSGQPVIAIKSNTRRGRVGKGVAQTLDTSCNQGVIIEHRGHKDKTPKIITDGIVPCLRAESHGHESKVLVKKEKCIPVLTPDRVEKKQNGRRFKEDGEEMFTITTQDRHGVYDGYRIRRLTPIECFRLMDFPDSLVQNAYHNGMKDSQLYKQAGNSIVVQHQVDINSFFAKLILNTNG
jgi:hypothetical protein